MKRLVVCCDGTWQRLQGDKLTNVALTARAISPRDRVGNPQIVYYSPGVGASVDGLNVWQGVTGDDLDEHLIGAYLFLTLNYEPGDELYLFGLSRGAYTVRSLAGLVRKCGILRRESSDKARAALELYRHRKIDAESPEAKHFRACYAIAWPRLEDDGETPEPPMLAEPPVDLRIRYLGVWDTVGALGIPRVLPFSFGDKARYEFHDTSLSRAVAFARHAVAIDEKRAAFTPTLWDNVEAFNPPGAAQRVAQHWFPGDHGGVGGGETARGLSNCALLWMIEGAETAGLAFARQPGSVLSGALAEIDPIEAPIGESGGLPLLDLLGLRWRTGPGDFADLHETARLRWAANPSYRPRPLEPYGQEILETLRATRAA